MRLVPSFFELLVIFPIYFLLFKIQFTYNTMYKSEVFSLMNTDNCIYPCHHNLKQGIKHKHSHYLFTPSPPRGNYFLSFSPLINYFYLFLNFIKIESCNKNSMSDFFAQQNIFEIHSFTRTVAHIRSTFCCMNVLFKHMGCFQFRLQIRLLWIFL